MQKYNTSLPAVLVYLHEHLVILEVLTPLALGVRVQRLHKENTYQTNTENTSHQWSLSALGITPQGGATIPATNGACQL